MSAASTVPIAWLVARGAGLAAFGFLTLSVWAGLAVSTRLLPGPPARLVGVHRTLSWMGLGALGLHAGALLLDPVIHFDLVAVLVPLAAPWRPLAVAAGVLAGWLALALAVSFPLRRHLGRRGWRRLHYASFAAFLLALVHALTSGTDLAGIGGPILALAAGLPVLWLTLVRILLPRPGARPARPPALTTARRA